MKIRFRKRMKIAPGVTLNISRTGLSGTVGPRGLSMNVGKKGTYLNAGIPGTGLYTRTRLDRPAGTKGTSPAPPRPRTKGPRWLGHLFWVAVTFLILIIALPNR